MILGDFNTRSVKQIQRRRNGAKAHHRVSQGDGDGGNQLHHQARQHRQGEGCGRDADGALQVINVRH
jgi:hypothetical protein